MKIIGWALGLSILYMGNFALAGQLEDILLQGIRDDNLTLVQSALKQGANPNFEYRFTGSNNTVWYSMALIEATTQVAPLSIKNRLRIISALIEAGADSNIQTQYHADQHSIPSESQSWGYSALMGAANNGFIEAAKILIANGAKLNLVTQGVCPVSAVWLSSYTGRPITTEVLIESGADFNFRGGCFNETPLTKAKEGIRKVLTSKTSMEWGETINYSETFRVLLGAGAHE